MVTNVAPRIVVMGVCGCGKSTVGRRLAEVLGLDYVEGDDLHSRHNVALMAAGTPLTDADRHGWLQAVARQLTTGPALSQGVVVACSALKQSYRDLLRAAAPDLLLVHLTGARALLEQRLAARADHYMPPTLLQSQIDTLEPPTDDEHAITLDIGPPPDALVAVLEQRLKRTAP